MSAVAALIDAVDSETFGPKAVQLGVALRAGLPVPGGFAISHDWVAAVGSGDAAATDLLVAELESRCPPSTYWAVRSSGVGEDSEVASFAGVHKSILGVSGAQAIVGAVREVCASANDPGATAYRAHLRLDPHARMAAIVQELVDSDVGGVMFTRNPVSGAAERVIEASWGLGEAVVSGLVTPDRFVLDPAGNLRECQPGEKDIAVRRQAGGGTAEAPVANHLVTARCLSDDDLAGLHKLARRCDDAFASSEHDIEFAIAAGRLHLLQRRAITRG